MDARSLDTAAYAERKTSPRAHSRRLAGHSGSFFHDPGVWAVLAALVLKPLVARVSDGEAIRCWVAGCATGEDAYSLAMLLLEELQTAGKDCRIEILATDDNAAILEVATRGEYLEQSLINISAQSLRRYFLAAAPSGRFKIKPQLARGVVFRRQETLAQLAFPPLDLVCCRYLLTQLAPAARYQFITSLQEVLAPGAALFLGAGQTPGAAAGLFQPLSPDEPIFIRLGATAALNAPDQVQAELQAVTEELSRLEQASRIGNSAGANDDGIMDRERQDGPGDGAIDACYDMAERQQVEERIFQLNRELRRRAIELQVIFDNVPAGILVATDSDCTRIRCNYYMEALLGGTAKLDGINVRDLAGYANYQLKRGNRVLDPLMPLRKIAQSGLPAANEECQLLVPQREPIDVLVNAVPLLDEAGLSRGAVAVVQDITERKRAERDHAELLAREQALRSQAETANRSKDDFLAVLSHELRTPLNAILGWVQTLEGGKAGKTTQVRALRAIEQSARAQSRLIEDLLNVSDIVAGRLRLDVHQLSLSTVISSAIESLRPAIAAKDIFFSCQFDAAADSAIGDPARIQQIVWNVLANAVKFTPRNGEIHLNTTRLDEYVEIAVEDSGEGINAEFLPYVFDRFRQADASRKRRHGGLGLGLAIARHLVEMHGGTVEAYSAGKGLGARFAMRLPVRASPPAQVGSSQQAETQSGQWRNRGKAFADGSRLRGLRILSVDDDGNTREMLKEALSRAGGEVQSAASAAEALDLLQVFRPQVLISDIGLPGEDGYDLLRRLRARRDDGANIPAVALSGYAARQDKAAAAEAGYQAFVTKPVDLSELIAAIIAVSKVDT